jgi:hypothetical protein
MHQTSFYCTLESHLNAHFIYLILLSLVFEVKIKEYLNKFEINFETGIRLFRFIDSRFSAMLKEKTNQIFSQVSLKMVEAV